LTRRRSVDWIGYYQTLLEAIASDMERDALRLPMLKPAEEQSLHACFEGPIDPIPELTIHELVEQQANATPDAVAVRFEDETVSYSHLMARVDALAGRLIAAGVVPETPVAIYLDRSVDYVVAMLAVLKAGGAYVPLDPIYPPARISAIISEADVGIAVTTAALGEAIKTAVPVCIHVEDSGSGLAEEPSHGLPHVHPADLAYRIFTSGSTGRPKGIDIEHRSVVNLLTAMRQTPGIRASDIFLAVTTPCFDIAVLELFLPLISGAQLVIASRADLMDPFRLVGLIGHSATTMMQATPALWRILLETGLDPAGLKILCGGEALDQKLAEDLGRGEVWNMYGPTETTIWSLAQRQGSGPIEFGRPIANTQMVILDAAGNTVPIGVPGELCISGAGLARGYYKNQALTAQCFPQNPFRGGTKSRMPRPLSMTAISSATSRPPKAPSGRSSNCAADCARNCRIIWSPRRSCVLKRFPALRMARSTARRCRRLNPGARRSGLSWRREPRLKSSSPLFGRMCCGRAMSAFTTIYLRWERIPSIFSVSRRGCGRQASILMPPISCAIQRSPNWRSSRSSKPLFPCPRQTQLCLPCKVSGAVQAGAPHDSLARRR
jgi:amino acid adenylation domain-containing protein